MKPLKIYNDRKTPESNSPAVYTVGERRQVRTWGLTVRSENRPVCTWTVEWRHQCRRGPCIDLRKFTRRRVRCLAGSSTWPRRNRTPRVPVTPPYLLHSNTRVGIDFFRSVRKGRLRAFGRILWKRAARERCTAFVNLAFYNFTTGP